MPARIAHSDRSCGEPGSFIPGRGAPSPSSPRPSRPEAARLLVLVGARQAGQDQRLLAVDEVAAVELGADLDGQLAVPQAPRTCRRVGRREREVAAEADEHLHLAAMHRLDRLDRPKPVLAGRLDPADLAEPVEEAPSRAVVDPAGAVALDVAVPANRAGPRAFPADVAAQQEQVDDLADRVDAVLVLGDAQAPGDDDPVRPD